MITLMLMFFACNDKVETTDNTTTTTAEQVETVVTPTNAEVKETPVKNDNKKVEVKTAENTETTNSAAIEATGEGDDNATNDQFIDGRLPRSLW